MKARVALCVCTVCVLMMLAGCFQVIVPPSVDYYVTPDEIVSEFIDDEFAATAKYDNKTIAVSGYVTNKDIGDSGEPFVGLKESLDSGGLDGVVCVFPRSSLSKLVSIQPDNHLTIVGEFDQYGSYVVCYIWSIAIVKRIVQLKYCRLP